MAQRRMISKKITETDLFMDMPLSSQALYFHLNVSADDDGFVGNPRKIQRSIGASDDDMKILFAKQFILGFESGVIVIKHWKIHNYIQTDRYAETLYIEEKRELEEDENKVYTKCIQNVYTGKVSLELDKVSLEKDINKEKNKTKKKEQSSNVVAKSNRIDFNFIKEQYNSICIQLPKVLSISETRKVSIRTFNEALDKVNKDGNTNYTIIDYFETVANIPFLNGDNKEHWTANFDWIINKTNMLKVLEGRYKSTNKEDTKRQERYDVYQRFLDSEEY